MSRKKCICVLLYVIHHFCGSTAITIKLDYNGTGFLGGNETELVCSFSEISDDKVIQLNVLNKNATGSMVPIAVFRPDGSVNLTNVADYLNGRVELKNAIKVSRQITMRIIFLACGDENDYVCRLIYFDELTLPATLDSDTKRIIIKASPSQPESVSQLNSTQVLEEGQDATFKCDGNVGKPPGKYIWQKIRKNNNELTLYDNVTTVTTQALYSCTYNGTSNLTFVLAAEDNQAIMRCAEQSMSSLYKDSMPINVLYKVRKPTITKHPNETYYVVGTGYIELKCHADGNPQSNYTWFKDDIRNHTLSTSFSLIIESNYTTNNGTYVCHAFNSWNGNIYDQFQSVDISIVYNVPTSIPTSTSTTVIITTENKAFCNQDYCKIGFGVGGGLLIGLVITIIFGIFRSRRKKFDKFPDTDNANLGKKSPRDRNGLRSGSMNRGYDDTEDLPMSSLQNAAKKGTSSKENKTLKYVEIDFVGDETSEITKDKKPVQEQPVRKNETVYSVVQKTKSVGNPKERMFTEEKRGSQRDEDDPYADNKELYDHLDNRRHKTNIAGEIFDHQQSSLEAKNSKKF